MTIIAICMACAAVFALLGWGWLASVSLVRAQGRADLTEQRRAATSCLEAFAQAKELDGDKFTAAALRSAAAYIWTGAPPETSAALRNETRHRECEREKAQAN